MKKVMEISNVQVPVSSSNEEDYYTVDSQEMQTDQDPIDHDLPATPLVSYSGDVNIPANEVNGWERLPVGTGSSLGQFLSTSCCLVGPASHEPSIFFKSLFDERMWTTIAQQANIYTRFKIRTACQGMDAIDAMLYSSHRQHVCQNT